LEVFDFGLELSELSLVLDHLLSQFLKLTSDFPCWHNANLYQILGELPTVFKYRGP
jgi:hypothetical protein